MLYAHIVKRFVTAFLVCLLIIPAHATVKPVSLKDCLKKGLIRMSACSNGGYIGKCLDLTLKNNTDKDLLVKVDPALIFRPEGEQYQHLVAVGQEIIMIPAKKTATQPVQTFCGKSKAASPVKNLSFKYWLQSPVTSY